MTSSTINTMGSAGIKNNVKTLFLILNTLTALLPGLLCVPIGLLFAYATGLQYGVEEVGISVAVGLIALGIAALGYVGAIKDKKIKLYLYTGLMVLAAIGDIVGLAIVHRREVVLKVVTSVHLGGLFLPGLFSTAIGLSLLAGGHGADAVSGSLAVGLIMLSITALGYVGAVNDKKIMLYIYTGLMVVPAIGDIVGFAVVPPREIVWKTVTSVHLGGLLATVALAVVLARLPPRSGRQGAILSPAPTSYTPNVYSYPESSHPDSQKT